MDEYIRHYSNEPLLFICNVCGITLKPYSMKHHKSCKRHLRNVEADIQYKKQKNHGFKSTFSI